MTKRESEASRVGLLGLVAVSLAFTACEATVGAKNLSIPRDAAHQCAVHCQSIGLTVTAVAIMAENVGCVCQYIPKAPPAPAPAAPPAVPAPVPPATSDLSAGPLGTPVAGMATIAVQQAAAAALLAHQRTQQQQSRLK